LECGHAIHKKCINEYIENIITEKNNITQCPICRKVLINLEDYSIINYETENNLYHNSSNIYNVSEEAILENNFNEFSNIDRISMEISEIIREMNITNLVNQGSAQNIR
jgi:hypothetical protein